MITDNEVSFLVGYSNNLNCTKQERAYFASILDKVVKMSTAPKPEIIVTLEGGCYQYAHANMDLDLIIEDLDCIKNNEGELFYTSPVTEDYDLYLRKAKNEAKKPREIRIFIHDDEDEFPYNLLIDGEVVETFKNLIEAVAFLQEYTEESNASARQG